MSEHTTGPWLRDMDDPWRVNDATGRGICDLNPPGSDIGKAESFGNARLISAAPDLLTACEGLLSRYLIMGCGEGPEAWAAKQAIAKAKGVTA